MYVLFFLLWVIFNGRITTEIVVFGIVIAAAMFAFMCKFMDYSLKQEKKFYCRIGFFIKYVVILIVEIVKANMAVIHMILTGREIMEPVIVRFKTNLKSSTLRVILANSITLTPGTITVSLFEDTFMVHCLDKSLAEGIEDSIFVKMLEEMEKKGE